MGSFESFVISFGAGILVELAKLVGDQVTKGGPAPDRGRPQPAPLRAGRLEERVSAALAETLKRLSTQLTDEERAALMAVFMDPLVPAEVMTLLLAPAEADPVSLRERLTAQVARHGLTGDPAEHAATLLSELALALMRVVAEDEQLRFLREVTDHARLAKQIGDLATDSGRFYAKFIALQQRQVSGLLRVHGETNAKLADVTRLLSERLPEPPPAPDYAQAEEAYRQFITNRHGRVSLWSVKADRPLSAELEQVYVNLRTQAERQDLRPWLGVDRYGMAALTVERQRELATVGIQEALKDHGNLVIVGKPGSGKTTLLKYLALTFARDRAGERLNLDERRLPILVPLRDFNRYLDNRSTQGQLTNVGPRHLLDFVPQYVHSISAELTLPHDFFERALKAGQCAVLLDGVDEVPTPEERGRIGHAVAGFIEAYPGNRYVITSRPHGFRGAALQALGAQCADCFVEDFRDQDIKAFVGAWYEATLTVDAGDTPETKLQAQSRAADLVKAIAQREQIRHLARNPLLLSVLAAVHYRNVQLPQRRVEVYNECVEFLLGYWDEIADPDSEARRDLARLGGRDRGWKRKFIAPVALAFHERHTQEAALADFKDLLLKRLGRPDDPETEDRAEAMLRTIEERSGLIHEPSPGRYSFPHLTFQEYLAAWTLGEQIDPFKGMAQRVGDEWWKEVVLLEAAHLSVSSEERTTHFVSELLACARKGTPGYCRNLLLAGQCLVDCTQDHVEWDLWQCVTNELVAMLDDGSLNLDLRLRIDAANTLGHLGDPRLGEMITIPAGEFLRGTREEDLEWVWKQFAKGSTDPTEWLKFETPQRTVYLDEFRIDRYPVTNAQYQAFVDATKHEPPRGWDGANCPADKANHPVVGVTWQDAMAYAEWAGKRLPTEAEWEKAARGTDGRLWPWGEGWGKGRCNSEEAGLGGTTPVGIFSAGRSPFGVEDMAGNVLEWCADWFGQEYYRSAVDRNPEGPRGGSSKVLRGGCAWTDRGSVRCASRGGGFPGGRDGYFGFRCAR
jgi:formylglycine-generating enzyme required for sulfatase activity/energy-coupling factor transporter ATP-binding protein EcfA2